jgi:hypothetical protein
MEHDSLADFTDKVTSKELFNITIKESLVLHCLEMLLNPFCFNSKVSLHASFWAKSQKVMDTAGTI